VNTAVETVTVLFPLPVCAAVPLDEIPHYPKSLYSLSVFLLKNNLQTILQNRRCLSNGYNIQQQYALYCKVRR
jgi:hypothetical protein